MTVDAAEEKKLIIGAKEEFEIHKIPSPRGTAFFKKLTFFLRITISQHITNPCSQNG